MEICINHNDDYYTYIELDYVPNLPHSKSSKWYKKNLKKKKKEKRRGLLSTFSLISPLLKKMFCTWLIVQLAMYKTFSTFEF